MQRCRARFVERQFFALMKARQKPTPARAQRHQIRRRNNERAARPQNAMTFSDEIERAFNVFDAVNAHDRVKRIIREVQRLVHVRDGEVSMRELQDVLAIGRCNVNAFVEQTFRERARAAWNVQHAPTVCFFGEHRGDNIVRVLRSVFGN